MEDLEFEEKKIYMYEDDFSYLYVKKKIQIQTKLKKVIFELSHFGH